MKLSLPLDGRSYIQRIEEAKQLLVENGYIVRGPLISKTKVKTTKDLVTFFYDTLTKNRPELKLGYGGDRIKELGIAAKFIESRMSTGISRARAIGECCNLIEILFKYEHLIGLEQPVLSMSVLGQDSMRWVTEKLLSLYEGFNYKACEEEDQQWYEELRDTQEKGVDEARLLRKEKELDEILDRILNNYGEEEG